MILSAYRKMIMTTTMNKKTGHLLWGLLHNFASQYPDTPTEHDIKNARLFLNAFEQVLQAVSHGCPCQTEWRHICQRSPARLENNQALSAWCNAVHDWVNQKLEKPIHNSSSLEHDVFKKLSSFPLKSLHEYTNKSRSSKNSTGCKPCGSS